MYFFIVNLIIMLYNGYRIDDSMNQKVIIDGKEEEIYIINPDEIEDNSDLLNLEDTMDLSEVVIDE